MYPAEFLELTPLEIFWKIEAYQEEFRQRHLDIYNLVVLIRTDDKHFPKKFGSFYKEPAKEKQDEKDLRKQAAGIGMRVP